MKLGIRELLFLSVMLAMLACTYFLIFKKASERREQKLAQIEAREKQMQHLAQITAGIQDLDAKVAELQQAIAFFESKLPQEREVGSVLDEVSQIALANSLQTRTFRTLKAERHANYSEQPIEMTLTGDFNGFYSFLLQLEKLPRITRILQMNLKKINDRDGAMQADLTLSIFYEPESRVAATY